MNKQSFSPIVLLIDDQPIIAEAVKRMLADQSDIAFHYCSDPTKAVAIAAEIKPTVILQDLVMPELDGLTLLKDFRSNEGLKEIPIVVLSTKEEPQVKARAFTLGANDYIVKLPDRIELIARIRYHSNAYIRLLERNDAFNRLEESQIVLHAELAEAAAYVKSLLPVPLQGPVEIDWRFIPSTQLGGDAFGYHWLDEERFAVYLLDVCGHGVGAALHSISIINVLRSRSLPMADFSDPSSVLKALNTAFQMEDHNNMFLTIWYGIFDKGTGKLTYSCGGHPPALLFTGDSLNTAQLIELRTPGIVIGAFPEADYENASCQLGKFNRLFVFSDGVFEIPKQDGTMMNYHEFTQFLMHTARKEGSELEDILQTMQSIQGRESFADDFCLLQVTWR
jgi:sigma-B regulation protein RsbU (phosphoserine phosphatase)